MNLQNDILMRARLGMYENPSYIKPGVVDNQSARLETMGGYRQQDRMIRAKRLSFDRALYNSYQAAEIIPMQQHKTDEISMSIGNNIFNLIGNTNQTVFAVLDSAEDIIHVYQQKMEEDTELQYCRGLINPNVTKQDYDDKILSIGYEHNLKPGDVFYWKNTKTAWLIYLQDLTELAYFKGDIRKCNYYIRWKKADGEITGTWIAMRGPVETNINYIQKSGISVDTPNYSLNILMPKNEDTLEYFQRYSKFYLTGADSVTSKTCWRVEATDALSMPGILEITAQEYYANETEDANGIVGELVTKPAKPEANDDLIRGDSVILPKQFYTYNYIGNEEAEWKVESLVPVQQKINGNTIELMWPKTYSGDITLSFGSSIKNIHINSLF